MQSLTQFLAGVYFYSVFPDSDASYPVQHALVCVRADVTNAEIHSRELTGDVRLWNKFLAYTVVIF